MSESDFLLNLALTVFNRQFNRNFTNSDFCLFSIQPPVNFDLGYEILSITDEDKLRLRIYLTINKKDDLSNFRVEVDYPSHTDGLGDEIYVALGEVDRAHMDNGTMRFRPINTCGILLNAISTEDGEYITTEDGEIIVTENVVI